jgi:sugar lactone lactonase YvrE
MTLTRCALGIWGLLCLLALSSCAGGVSNTPATPTHAATATSIPTSTATPIPRTPPAHYNAHILLQGSARPDDLAFDPQGHLLFSDFYAGTVSRLNSDGSTTVVVGGVKGPEGLVVLSDGTLIIAEQRTNRILKLAPGATTPTLLAQVPGTPSGATCKDGVDGIAFDATTNTLIIPDSPTGDVYRLSLDGQTLTKLTSGITRPVGALADSQGNIYVADECGGKVWKLTPAGDKTSLGGFGMPDDLAFDLQGDLLVTDLRPNIHALVRVNLTTGQHETLASDGFIEPQGMVVDSQGNIYVSDDQSNRIVEFTPAP